MKKTTLWACLLLLVSAAFADSHKVQPGENDHSIARKYGISVKQLHEANSNVDWKKLQIGKSLTIPGKPSPVSKAKPVNVPKANATHTVVAGESDWSISHKYGLTVAQLQALNPNTTLSPLRLGTTLKVHKAVPATKVAAKPAAKPAPKPVAVKPTPKPVAQPSAGITSVNAEVSGNDVALRSAAAKTAGKVATLKKGNIGQIIDRQGEWYRLKFMGGAVGWVSGDCLKGTSKTITAIATPAKPKSARVAHVGSGISTSMGMSLINTALAQQGVRYVWGGTSRSGFDCSGFVQYVFRQHGINLPRTSREQATRGTAVSRSSLRAGDCLFFVTRGRSISHVGIYIGNNKFVHASSGGGRVRVNELSGYYDQRFAGARRMSNKFVGSEVAQLEFDNWANSLPTETIPDDVDPEPDMVVSENRGTDAVAP